MHVGIEYLIGTVEKLEFKEDSVDNIVIETPVSEVSNETDPFDEKQVGEDILKLLFDEEKISQMTDVNNSLVVHMARAEFMADRYNSPKLRAYVLEMKKLRISLGREGRKEASHLLSSQFDRLYNVDPVPTGLFDSLFAGKGK